MSTSDGRDPAAGGAANGRATEELRREHRLILVVVDALERMLDAPAPGDGALGRFEECVTFFRLFTDACHHHKEEDLLFAELEARGLPRDEGPIAVMLEEHARGRALVGRMRAELERARAGATDARPDFEAAARDYVDLIRGHIAKEDGPLFGMADRLIDGDDCARLCERYADACARRFEGRTLADLEAMAERLGRAAPGAAR